MRRQEIPEANFAVAAGHRHLPDPHGAAKGAAMITQESGVIHAARGIVGIPVAVFGTELEIVGYLIARALACRQGWH